MNPIIELTDTRGQKNLINRTMISQITYLEDGITTIIFFQSGKHVKTFDKVSYNPEHNLISIKPQPLKGQQQ